MLVSAEPQCVNVLVEHQAGTYATTFVRDISVREIAEELHTMPDALTVVGLDSFDHDRPLRLRNGDILHDNLLMPSYQPLYGWPDDNGDTSNIVLPIGITVAAACVSKTWFLLSLLHMMWTPGLAARSRSPHRLEWPAQRRRQAEHAPRFGRWRPDSDRPLSDVVVAPSFSYRVLCPYQGWSPPFDGAGCTSMQSLTAVLQGWCSIWALRPVLQSGPGGPDEGFILPGGLAPLATVVIYAPGLIMARLLPRVLTYQRLRTCTRRIVAVGAAQLRLHPALLKFVQQPDVTLQLRDGDSVELYYEPTHLAYRPASPLPTYQLRHLPHFGGWHMPFRLGQSGWVTVWGSDSYGDCEPTTRWVSQGAVWSPGSCHFHRPGTHPPTERWVPTAWLEDSQCHFVQQTAVDQACVIFCPTDDRANDRGTVLVTSLSEEHIPVGWQLRPDLQGRSPLIQLRDGDILVPTDRNTRRRVHRVHGQAFEMISAASALIVCRRSIGLALGLGFLLPLVQGVVEPLEAPLAAHVRVGRYAWRVPEALRLCDAAVDPGHRACLISPFTGRSESVAVHPDLSVDELCSQLAGSEPGWADGIIPVWPALQPQHLSFLPAVDCHDLVVLLFVSPEWQAAYILPRRADPTWILNTLRRGSSETLCGLRPPLASAKPGASASQAIDWRTGDVVLVLPWANDDACFDLPHFQSGSEVRHTAIWAFDFQVLCDLPVTLWRPGLHPARTTMPGPSRWCAYLQTFAGTFSRRYPGQWVPVPWIYNDEVHLCQRAIGEHDCNVVLEELRDNSLRGQCVTLHTWTTPSSIAHDLGVPADRVVLLGHLGQQRTGSLRDGDVIHYPISSGVGRSTLGPALLGAVLMSFVGRTVLRPLLSEWMVVLSFWLLACTDAAPLMREGPAPPSTGSHWIWSPFTGVRGPNGQVTNDRRLQLYQDEPWWPTGLVQILPVSTEEDMHWVPRSPSAAFVVAMVSGPPAPIVALLPQTLPKHALLRLVQQYFAEAIGIKGRIPGLAEHVPGSSLLQLRDGDAIVVQVDGWKPTLHTTAISSFPTHAQARTCGRWSHPLEFRSDCWLIFFGVSMTNRPSRRTPLGYSDGIRSPALFGLPSPTTQRLGGPQYSVLLPSRNLSIWWPTLETEQNESTCSCHNPGAVASSSAAAAAFGQGMWLLRILPYPLPSTLLRIQVPPVHPFLGGARALPRPPRSFLFFCCCIFSPFILTAAAWPGVSSF